MQSHLPSSCGARRRVPAISLDSWELDKLAAGAGSVWPNALIAADVDDDGVAEVVFGTTEGHVVVLKCDSRQPLFHYAMMATVSVVLYCMRHRRLIVVTLEGQCELFDNFLHLTAPLTGARLEQHQHESQGESHPRLVRSLSAAVTTQGGVGATASRGAVFHVAANCFCGDVSCDGESSLLVLGSYDRRMYIYAIPDGDCLVALFVHQPVTAVRAVSAPVRRGGAAGQSAVSSPHADNAVATTSVSARPAPNDDASGSDDKVADKKDESEVDGCVGHAPLLCIAAGSMVFVLPALPAELRRWKALQERTGLGLVLDLAARAAPHHEDEDGGGDGDGEAERHNNRASGSVHGVNDRATARTVTSLVTVDPLCQFDLRTTMWQRAIGDVTIAEGLDEPALLLSVSCDCVVDDDDAGGVTLVAASEDGRAAVFTLCVSTPCTAAGGGGVATVTGAAVAAAGEMVAGVPHSASGLLPPSLAAHDAQPSTLAPASEPRVNGLAINALPPSSATTSIIAGHTVNSTHTFAERRDGATRPRPHAFPRASMTSLSSLATTPLPTAPGASPAQLMHGRGITTSMLRVTGRCAWAARLGHTPLVPRVQLLQRSWWRPVTAVFVAVDGICYIVHHAASATTLVTESTVKPDCSSFLLVCGTEPVVPDMAEQRLCSFTDSLSPLNGLRSLAESPDSLAIGAAATSMPEATVPGLGPSRSPARAESRAVTCFCLGVDELCSYAMTAALRAQSAMGDSAPTCQSMRPLATPGAAAAAAAASKAEDDDATRASDGATTLRPRSSHTRALLLELGRLLYFHPSSPSLTPREQEDELMKRTQDLLRHGYSAQEWALLAQLANRPEAGDGDPLAT